jgi:hypothetical protein
LGGRIFHIVVCLKTINFKPTAIKYGHRCSRVENPIFAIKDQGGRGFQDKIAKGLPILGFIAFL